MYCTNCGNKLNVEHKFCTKCGQKNPNFIPPVDETQKNPSFIPPIDETQKSKDELYKLKDEISKLKNEKSNLIFELNTLKNEILTSTVKTDEYENISSQEIKNKLQMIQLAQEDIIKSNNAVSTNHLFPVKILEAHKKQILRCFNWESKYIIESVTTKNIDATRNKLQKSYITLNNIFAIDDVKITSKYFETKLNELTIIYEYMKKIEEEKEQQKAIREQLLEEEKLRQEIEREKLRIEKEEYQFKNEVDKLMKYLSSSKNDIEKQLYIDKIKELEDKLKMLEKDKGNVLQREQNTRAGFVYIISNIGSFGENVYKIGMTRRLEPLDRIKELGDASVPFQFDVHALIFSEDAPTLENILHQTFKENQLNKINTRKEFFKIDLDKIKEVVMKNYNATVKFIDYPEAYEYRESQKLLV